MIFNNKWDTKKVIVVAVIALLIVLFMILGVKNIFDRNAKKGSNDALTKEEIRAQLQDEADKSGFRIQINTAPTVQNSAEQGEDAQQTADWCIMNSVENTYNMKVVITMEDGTDIYQSKELVPGDQELIGALKKNLEPGTYALLATATAIDPESGDTVGTASTDLTLTVESQQSETQG